MLSSLGGHTLARFQIKVKPYFWGVLFPRFIPGQRSTFCSSFLTSLHQTINQPQPQKEPKMPITKDEINSRFEDYPQQGEDFCQRATRHYEALFREQSLGTNVLVREHAKGLRELVKIYHTTADYLDATRASEATRKAHHE
jgi:hypothetical protein